MTDQVLERFWDKVKVDETTGCWNWTAYKDHSGYGIFRIDSKNTSSSHRFAYQVNKGKIPEGLQLDHLCKNRKCCNPEHLEVVTLQENTNRSEITIAVKNRNKTHCSKGHEYTPENTYVRKHGHRACRTCSKEWHSQYSKKESYKKYHKEYYENHRSNNPK